MYVSIASTTPLYSIAKKREYSNKAPRPDHLSEERLRDSDFEDIWLMGNAIGPAPGARGLVARSRRGGAGGAAFLEK